MFGIGFTELLLIAIIAVLFIGPDKLPETMVQIAKFIKSIKQTVGEAKSSLEEEMKIADLKEEALGYKQQLTDATSELKGFKNLSLDDFDKKMTYEDKSGDTKNDTVVTPVEPKQEHAELKKKPEKKKDPYAIADTTPRQSIPSDDEKREDS